MALEMEIIPIISNVGFPIGAFLLMWRFASTTIKENTAAIIQLKDAFGDRTICPYANK